MQLPDGRNAYTRMSTLYLDETGQIVCAFEMAEDADSNASTKYPLLPPVVIPQDTTRIEINPNGIVEAFQSEQYDAPAQLGRLELSMFQNSDGLKWLEKGLYIETKDSGAPIRICPGVQGCGHILQGYKLRPRGSLDGSEHLVVNGPICSGVDDSRQEKLIKTGRRLDYAIDGPGFFRVELPSGISGYTRYLPLEKDEDGRLMRRVDYGIGSHLAIRLNPKRKKRPGGGVSLFPPVPSITSQTASTIASESIPLPEPRAIPKSSEINNPKSDLFQLYRFPEPENLTYFLNGIYQETFQSGAPIMMDATETQKSKVMSGYLNAVPRLEP